MVKAVGLVGGLVELALVARSDPFFDIFGHAVPEAVPRDKVKGLLSTEMSRCVVMILDGTSTKVDGSRTRWDAEAYSRLVREVVP